MSVVLHAPAWRSSADYSRPAGDQPTTGDYITTAEAVYRVVDVRSDGGKGYLLDCEVAGGFAPWAKDENPNLRIFSWAWRTFMRSESDG